jgi:hypothetical protein
MVDGTKRTGSNDDRIAEVDFAKIDTPGTILVNEENSIDQKNLVFGKNNMPQMLQHLRHLALSTKNLVVNSSKMTAVVDEDGKIALIFRDEKDEDVVAYANGWAHGQIIDRSMGDRNYFTKCIKGEKHDLAEINLNNWLTAPAVNRMIRLTDYEDHKEIRAFLGSGYMLVDNQHIATEVLRATASQNAMRSSAGTKPIVFDRGSFSEGSMYIELLDTENTFDLGKGQTFNGMIVIKNSDVGGAALDFSTGFYQWTCANLHIKNTIFSKQHRAEKLDEQIFGQEIVQKQAKLLVEAVGVGIGKVLQNRDLFEKWASELRETTEVVIQDQTKALAAIKSEYELTDEEISSLTNTLTRDTTIAPELRGTAFGLISGITNMARDVAPDRRHELGEIAGNTARLLKCVA